MLGTCNEVAERLYLQKDASGDISVPCSQLAQIQIDGLRFLYSQYKKEKLGVIVNYSPGCGSSVQVAIFIGAICDKLKKPVLILYNSDQEKEAWLERFAKWTSISEDSIEVDTSNPYVRKQIFLNNITDVSKFYRRSWGIVVVKNDSFYNVFRKCQLQVDYKIWITAQNLKHNKELLHSVYSWINPSDKLLHEYLSRKAPLFAEDTTNDILLDLLLEDFLITRSGLKPFGAQKRKQDLEVPVLKVSKKNKDATGKKIKRSKKNQETPSTSTVQIESDTSLCDNSFELSSVFSKATDSNTVTNNISTNNVRENSKDTDDEESKMDVESFIQDNDPVKSDISLSFAINNLDSTSQPSSINSPKEEEVSTQSSLNFSSAIADIIRNENHEQTKISDDSISFKAENSKKDCDLTQEVTKDEEVNESIGFSKIDLSKPVIQKVFFNCSQDDASGTTTDQDTVEEKTDKKCSEESNENDVEDQTSKLEVSTSMIKETDDSFDSKMKEFEARALRKFKGSVLDSIF